MKIFILIMSKNREKMLKDIVHNSPQKMCKIIEKFFKVFKNTEKLVKNHENVLKIIKNLLKK